ncbi:MAG: response regulator [Acidobacteriota bacterium]
MTDVLQDALVLIAEDDPDIRRILRQYAERAGLRTAVARDGEEALWQYRAVKPDLVLLDINMPKRDGFDVLARIRQSGATPVIVVSARVEDEDKLHGLGLGADDYVVKPFNPQEVVARMAAVLRRTRGDRTPEVARFRAIEVHRSAGKAVVCRGAERTDLDLTPSEYRLLGHMIGAPHKVFSRLELLEACFPDSEALERTVDSHVSHLRKKLAAAGATGLLSVMRGVGYRLADDRAGRHATS